MTPNATKTLHLTLKKKWFDMILSGEKKEEYREIKDYWDNRLKDEFHTSFKHFDTITFKNGYAKNAPELTIKLLHISVDYGLKEWGADRGVKYFVLLLGEIISTKNIKL